MEVGAKLLVDDLLLCQGFPQSITAPHCNLLEVIPGHRLVKNKIKLKK
jgi:hypothetical protein